MKRKFIFLTANFLLLFMLAGCAKPIKYDDVKDYSDPVVNKVLTSINNLDYEAFASLLSNDMKDSYTLGTFQSETTNLINKLGSFEHADFFAGEERNGYINLIYHVKFSNEEEITPISITFKKDDNEHKVQQLYFDSALNND